MIFTPRQYVVELDGQTFQFKENRLLPIESIDAVEGDRYLITDMQEAISKTMTMDAPARYVELMIRRKLQESGEFEEPVTVLTHWKKARSKNSTDVFFTAVPTRLSVFYTEQVSENSDSVLVFPIYTLLYNTLKRFASKKPVALVFQHGRFADVIIGNSRRIYYAIRCTAFDISWEQLLTLWETVRGEIEMAEGEHRIKIPRVYALNWIDSVPLPKWDDNGGRSLIPLPASDLLLEESTLSISFFESVRKLPLSQSISSITEKLFYGAALWTRVLTGIIFLTALILLGTSFYFNYRTKDITARMGRLEAQYHQIRSQMPVLSSAVDYQPTLKFIKELSTYPKIPHYKQVISDLNDAMSVGMTLEVLKLTYLASELQLELFGPIEAPFEKAHAGYQRFLKVIHQRGYIVVESKFDTVIDHSEIMVRLVKRWT